MADFAFADDLVLDFDVLPDLEYVPEPVDVAAELPLFAVPPPDRPADDGILYVSAPGYEAVFVDIAAIA